MLKRMHSKACNKALVLCVAFVVLLNPTRVVFSETGLESYKIQKFWDNTIGCVFHYQVQKNACASASVQMAALRTLITWQKVETKNTNGKM